MRPLGVRKVSSRRGKKKVLQIVVRQVGFLHPKFFKIAPLTALAMSRNRTTEFKVTDLINVIKLKVASFLAAKY